MKQKTWIIMSLIIGSWGIEASLTPEAWALGRWFGPKKDPYMLNLCEYYALGNTRIARINPGLLLTEARVEARVISENCPVAEVSASETIETVVQTPYIVELVDLREVLSRVQDQFSAKAAAAHLKCTAEKHLIVTLVFNKIDQGTIVEMPPIDLKSVGRSGFIWDAQGRPLDIIERGPLLKSPMESLNPETRCESVMRLTPRIVSKK